MFFTDWSRKCARLWRSLHGRRFACYKERSDKGTTGTGLRLKGSMKAVMLQHRAATGALMRTAAAADSTPVGRDQPTVLGVGRAELARGARCAAASPDPAGKKLLTFRETTARRRREKNQGPSVWRGFGEGMPKLRPKPGKKTCDAMIAGPRGVEHARPRMEALRRGKWLCRAAAVARGKSTWSDGVLRPPPAAPQEGKRKATCNSDAQAKAKAKKQKVLTVKSLLELDTH